MTHFQKKKVNSIYICTHILTLSLSFTATRALYTTHVSGTRILTIIIPSYKLSVRVNQCHARQICICPIHSPYGILIGWGIGDICGISFHSPWRGFPSRVKLLCVIPTTPQPLRSHILNTVKLASNICYAFCSLPCHIGIFSYWLFFAKIIHFRFFTYCIFAFLITWNTMKKYKQRKPPIKW